METTYKRVTYGTGWAVKVTPSDRVVDVMHYLTTGGLLGGRSLDGVTWEDVEVPEISTKALGRSVNIVEEPSKEQTYMEHQPLYEAIWNANRR